VSSDDIVERLRALVKADCSRHLKDAAMLLAADEIERLRAQVAELLVDTQRMTWTTLKGDGDAQSTRLAERGGQVLR
jgi:hypothetical protein